MCVLGIDATRLCRSLCCTGADLDKVKDALYWWNPTKKARLLRLPCAIVPSVPLSTFSLGSSALRRPIEPGLATAAE